MSTSSKSPEANVVRVVKDVEKTIAESQVKVREALGVVGAAMLERTQELDAVKLQIDEAKAQLTELNDKKEVLESVAELKLQLEDAQLAHTRALAQLQQAYGDEEAAIARDKAEAARVAKIAEEDEARKRKLTQEDQDRAREQAYNDRKAQLDAQAADVAKKVLELGTFEQRVADEVAKAVKSEKAGFEFAKRAIETDLKAKISILEADKLRLEKQVSDLEKRLSDADARLELAQKRVEAIATATVEAESGKKALEELRSVANKQAEGRK